MEQKKRHSSLSRYTGHLHDMAGTLASIERVQYFSTECVQYFYIYYMLANPWLHSDIESIVIANSLAYTDFQEVI